jgi:hypothetical protein
VCPTEKPHTVRLDPALLRKDFRHYTAEETALWKLPDVAGRLEAARLRLALLATVHNAAQHGAGTLSGRLGDDAGLMLYILTCEAWEAVNGLCEALPADVQNLRIQGVSDAR